MMSSARLTVRPATGTTPMKRKLNVAVDGDADGRSEVRGAEDFDGELVAGIDLEIARAGEEDGGIGGGGGGLDSLGSDAERGTAELGARG